MYNNLNFECSICLDNIKFPTVGSCMHHFCYFCLHKYCRMSNNREIYPKCPLCNEPINELKLDREFDKLLTGDNLPTFETHNKILNPLDHIDTLDNPGLTIKNNKIGPGVVIIKLKENGLFNKYNFTIGDIILFINDIPCINHKIVIEQIMNLFNARKLIKIILL